MRFRQALLSLCALTLPILACDNDRLSPQLAGGDAVDNEWSWENPLPQAHFLFGVWGDTAKTLKPLTDIQRKKKALPMVHLLEASTEEDRAWLQEAHRDDEVSSPNVRRILALLDRLGAREYVTRTAAACASEAVSLAGALGLPAGRQQTLEAIAAYCVQRER